MRWDACLVAAIALAVAAHAFVTSRQPESPDALALAAVAPPQAVLAEGALPVLAREAPRQTSLPEARRIDLTDHEMELVAEFRVAARVLSAQRYFGDDLAALAPVDLAMGWGEMANPDKAEQLSVRQFNRFFFWSFPPGATLSEEAVARSTANMHLVPATQEIAAQLQEVAAGDLVDIAGYLVDVRATDGRSWRTSRTRDDTGAGACEIILVTALDTQ